MNAPLILVIADPVRDAPSRSTLELIGLARCLAEASGGAVGAALVTREAGDVPAALIARGADRVFVAQHAALAGYHSEAWVSAVARICREAAPAVVLAGHHAAGADLAPRLAFRLGTAVATGCIELKLDSGKLLATRPCYGGNARETVSFKTAPAVATIRPGSYDALPPDAARCGEVKLVPVELDAELARVTVLERQREAEDGARLENARVIVAGGRGLDGPEGFRLLEQLAGALGGAVGASRVPCDLGWCPRSWQIGLTGKTVRPDLYIAVGISGAGHHMAGCGNAKAIVAVNTDPEAAIFRAARFGVVGDYREFIPALIGEVRRIRAAGR
jgi:electron transfer flavoprotein alpha subunit